MKFCYLIFTFALTEDVASVANSRSFQETAGTLHREHLGITIPLEVHRKPAKSAQQFLPRSSETLQSHNNLTASVWGHQTWAPASNPFASDHTLHLPMLRLGHPQ